jgi:AcrR family transcriptional regulator
MSEVKGQSRRDRARETRQRILRAADEEFRANGYQGTTMAAVAKRAAVAVQTVYFVFHTKVDLLNDVYDAAVLGDDGPPPSTEWFRAAITAVDPRQSLRLFVEGTSGILGRAASLAAVAKAAAVVDPEAGEVQAEHERLRVEGYRDFLGHVTGLEADLDTATDVLLTLLGPGTYLAFVADRGWTPERYVDWTADALADLLLTPGR